MQIGLLSSTDIRFIKEINGYETRFLPDWLCEGRTPVDLRKLGRNDWHAHQYSAVLLLRFVRCSFPYFAVVFRDGNLQDDLLMKVDLAPLQERVKFLTVTGPSLLTREFGKTTEYLIANLGTDDLLTLVEGFEEDVPPAVFLFCGSSRPLSSEQLVDAAKNSSKEDDLISRLLNVGEVVLHPGPDAAYFVILSSTESNLKMILK